MAGTTVRTRTTGHRGSDVQALRIQLNAAIDDLDAVVLAAATNIAAVAAVTITAAKVADALGNTTK